MANRKFLLNIVIALVILASVGSAAYFYSELHTLKNNPNQQAENEMEELVKKVSQLIVLPDEKPTIMTVSDVEKLKGQAFFERAMTGDKVLVYASAKKAVLYSPEQNKIVEVSSINLDKNDTAHKQKDEPDQPKKQ